MFLLFANGYEDDGSVKFLSQLVIDCLREIFLTKD